MLAAIVLAVTAWFIIGAVTNEAYGWATYRSYLFDTRIATAALHTLALTVLAMLIGVVLGATLAVMRMSPNPVLRGVAWGYLWVFRGTPVYVQLVFWGLLGSLYQSINVGFTEVDLSGMLKNAFILAVLGLGLNEAAYLAEIIRAGITSVPEGQSEASTALGMSWLMTCDTASISSPRAAMSVATSSRSFPARKASSVSWRWLCERSECRTPTL